MPPLLTTLGLFIIDENLYPPSWHRAPEYNIIGGGASYAIIGGRIAAGPTHGQRVCGILDMGTDFPAAVRREIEQWGSGAVFRATPNRLTTRGANVYDEQGVRTFVYRTPKKRIVAEDVVATRDLVQLASFHFCCAVERCVESINVFRAHGNTAARVIFEPFPEVCVAENLAALHRALPQIDVFTPNLNEAAGFYGVALPTTTAEIADLAARFYASSPPSGGVVLRCGPLGCYVKTKDLSIMLPAYHQDQARVVDVTGGGNSFCGGFMAALELSNDWLVAGVMGNIVSGIVIEKLGMPAGEGNRWNGASVEERLRTYVAANRELLRGFDVGRVNWLTSHE